jgi:hypothetical protein
LDAVREPLKSSTVERIEQWIRNEEDLKDFSKLKPSAGNPNPQYVLQRLVHKFNYQVREAKKGHFGKIGVKASEEEMQKYDNQGKLTKHDIAVGRIGNFSYTDSLHTKAYSWKEILRDDERAKQAREQGLHTFYSHSRRGLDNLLGKNPGDVWTISAEPFKEAHFAVFPTELVRRCIKAGCPENGIVLDPFVGSGTTIKVAIEERRNCIGIEIVPEYIEMAIRRCNLRNNPLIEFELKVI